MYKTQSASANKKFMKIKIKNNRQLHEGGWVRPCQWVMRNFVGDDFIYFLYQHGNEKRKTNVSMCENAFFSGNIIHSNTHTRGKVMQIDFIWKLNGFSFVSYTERAINLLSSYINMRAHGQTYKSVEKTQHIRNLPINESWCGWTLWGKCKRILFIFFFVECEREVKCWVTFWSTEKFYILFPIYLCVCVCVCIWNEVGFSRRCWFLHIYDIHI